MRYNTDGLTVTHQTSFVAQSDYVIALDRGQLVEAGWTDAVSKSENGHSKPQLSQIVEAKEDGIDHEDTGKGSEPEQKGVLHDEEERASGSVSWRVYKLYASQAGGSLLVTLIGIVVAVSLAGRVINQYWFVWWLDDGLGISSSSYMLGYGLLTLAKALTTGRVFLCSFNLKH